MNITMRREGGQVTIQLNGWLDTASAPQLKDAMAEITEADRIVLDFDQVEYIASAGLRQVILCFRRAKELNADFSVINAVPETMSIFQMTGIDQKITVLPKE